MHSLFTRSQLFGLAVAALVTGGTTLASAQEVSIRVDTSIADYIVEIACSGKPVDEDRLRTSRLLQTQIKHHAGNSERFDMDGYIEAAKAAARCETLPEDRFRFRYVVQNREQMAQAVAFLKEREEELAAFVTAKTAPYFPAGQTYDGEIVLVAASWSCGGFSMDGVFFIDVPCVAASVEDEFEAVKLLAAHETYHALQYAFFAPFSEDMTPISTPAQAQAYLFLNLLLEGTAEFVADSRDVPGEGTLATVFRDLSTAGYRQLERNFRWLDYAAAILAVEGDSNRRIRDVYHLGFSGSTGQKFYYVGAAMARSIEAVFGRDPLVCMMALSPEQFVLAYAASLEAGAGEGAHPVGPSALSAARSLGQGNTSYRSCLGM